MSELSNENVDFESNVKAINEQKAAYDENLNLVKILEVQIDSLNNEIQEKVEFEEKLKEDLQNIKIKHEQANRDLNIDNDKLKY